MAGYVVVSLLWPSVAETRWVELPRHMVGFEAVAFRVCYLNVSILVKATATQGDDVIERVALPTDLTLADPTDSLCLLVNPTS